jgi:hypothetical protein
MTTLCANDIHSSEAPNVLDFIQARVARGIRPPLTAEEMIKTAVARRLGGHYRLVPAQHRAVNLYHANVQAEEAIRRAVAWAECAIDPNEPRPAA